MEQFTKEQQKTFLDELQNVDTTYPSHILKKQGPEASPNYALDLYNLMRAYIFHPDEKNPLTIHNNINDMLLEQYDYEIPEQDALRHYLVTQSLAEEYGPNVAEFIGKWHENFYFKKDFDEQAQADLKNNKKALEDFKANKKLEEYNKSILDSLLTELTIPPTPEWAK